MQTPSSIEPPEDEPGIGLLPNEPDEHETIDAGLHLADMRRRHAGAEVQPVRFRRWEIVRRIGKGGMGAVYLARDPELDRVVALKVFVADAGNEPTDMRQRLMREAQALARIDHPNVVKVHHVDLDHGRPVIEMELVDGPTLRQWQHGRPWREVVAAYVDAGRGLAAIHAAGLVHRDVKPDNLLRGSDGRVKVVDLGLAIGLRARADQSATPAATTPSLLMLPITRDGAAAGTPVYMAPERLDGSDGSAASDQYSFAVSLYEALLGVPPFRPEDVLAHVEDVRRGREPRVALEHTRPRQATDERRLPKWLMKTLRRALRADPRQRHPSIEAMLAKLRWGLRRRRWWWFGGGIPLVGAGLMSLGWSLRMPAEPPCLALERELRDELQTDRLGPVRAVVREANAPHVARAFGLLDDTLSHATAAWLDGRLSLCEAQLGRQEPPATAMSRLECLADVREQIDAIVDGPEPGESELAGWLVDATKELERLPTCEGSPQRLSRELGEPAPFELRRRLRRALVLELHGNLAEAEEEARAVVERAGPHPRLRAEALYRLGHIQGSDERASTGFATLTDARNAALESDSETLMCEVVAYRAKLAALVVLDHDTSADDLGFAEACLDRVSARAVLLRSDLLEARGLLSQMVGEPAQAIEAHGAALELRLEYLGRSSYEVSKSLQNLATAQGQAGDVDHALTTMEQALHARVDALGPRHPKVADVLFDLGELQRERGDEARARASFEGALRIYVDAFRGPYPRQAANVYLSLALLDLTSTVGDLGAAADRLEQARRCHEGDRELGPDHPDRARVLQAEGLYHVRRGDFAQALPALSSATEMLRRHDPSSDDVLDGTLREIEVLYGLHEHEALARRVAREGAALVGYVTGRDPQERGRFAWYVGDSSLRARDSDQATRYLRIALDAYQVLEDEGSVRQLTKLLDASTRSSTPSPSL